MIPKWFRLAAHALLLSAAFPTSGWTIDEETDPAILEGLMGEVWKPAPTPPGALDWSILTTTAVDEKEIDNFLQYVPTFTDEVKKLDKKWVKINGYMIPMEPSDRQSSFILMAYPHACPFHLPGGPAAFIEVTADFPVLFTYDTVFIEGYFELKEEFSNGVFFRLKAAKEIKIN